MILAALIGYLWIEWTTVSKAIDDSNALRESLGQLPEDRFDFPYYFRKNLMLTVGNIIGVVLLLVAGPDILKLEMRYWSDAFPLFTGAIIGLLGSWLVRTGQDWIKAKINSVAS